MTNIYVHCDGVEIFTAVGQAEDIVVDGFLLFLAHQTSVNDDCGDFPLSSARPHAIMPMVYCRAIDLICDRARAAVLTIGLEEIRGKTWRK